VEYLTVVAPPRRPWPAAPAGRTGGAAADWNGSGYLPGIYDIHSRLSNCPDARNRCRRSAVHDSLDLVSRVMT